MNVTLGFELAKEIIYPSMFFFFLAPLRELRVDSEIPEFEDALKWRLL